MGSVNARIIFNKNKTIGELKTIYIPDDIEIEIFEAEISSS